MKKSTSFGCFFQFLFFKSCNICCLQNYKMSQDFKRLNVVKSTFWLSILFAWSHFDPPIRERGLRVGGAKRLPHWKSVCFGSALRTLSANAQAFSKGNLCTCHLQNSIMRHTHQTKTLKNDTLKLNKMKWHWSPIKRLNNSAMN